VAATFKDNIVDEMSKMSMLSIFLFFK